MHVIQRLQQLSTTRLWLLSTFFSVVLTEIIVCGMEMLLKGAITYDYLLTGFVTSLCVAALVAAALAFFLEQQRQASRHIEERSGVLFENNKLLLHEQDFLENIINGVAGVFYMLDDHGHPVRWNREMEKVTGYTADELAQMHVLDFFGGSNHGLITQKMQEVLEKGESSVEVELVTKHGQWKPYYFTWRRVVIGGKPYLVGIGMDIDERKLIEKGLRESQAALEELFESMSSGAVVYRTSPDGQDFIFTAVNRAAERIEKMSREDLIGKSVTEVFPGIVEFGLLDVFRRVWKSGVPEQFPASFYQDGRVSGWRENYVYKLPGGEIVAIYDDVTVRKQTEDQMHRMAHYDSLTGLPNRMLFMDRLRQEIKKASRSEHAVTLFYIDLDQFKEVNDTLGHHVGDTLLIEAAKRIVACVRDSDTATRLGGDEFTVILPELDDLAGIERVAQSIISTLTEPFLVGGETIYISASIGITLYPADGDDADSLLMHADQAMYVSKNAGRNRYSFFTNALQEKALTRSQLVKDLRGALAGGQFKVYFQPIVTLGTGKINKAEALLRWDHPVQGRISPAEFIPLAEETGLINEIGDWVFKQTAYWAQRWNESSPGGFQVSVNKSPIQFLSEIYHDDWLKHLRELGLAGRCMNIEITEGLLLNAGADVDDKLVKFRDAGIQVSIDDFGTGYSALSYLKKFDIDYLKIDQSFIRNLGSDPSDLILSEAIIVMAHKLGLKVIAEGVETLEQHNLLLAAGCDYAQGFLFSMAIPPEEFDVLLQSYGYDEAASLRFCAPQMQGSSLTS